MSEERSRIKVVIFALAGIIIVTACTIFVLQIIYRLWNPPFLRQVQVEPPVKVVQMEALARGIQPDNRTVAHRSVNDEFMDDRFHDWKIPTPKDEVNVCINCHGNMPHNKDERQRAFLNKHVMYTACETCHMPVPGGRGEFVWYDVETGDIRNTLPIQAPLRVSHFKMTVLSPEMHRYSFANPSLMAASNDLLNTAAGMGEQARKKELDRFHMNKLATPPVECRKCHPSDITKLSYVPFLKLGYNEFRARQIISSEVVGMIENYGVFYLPTFLNQQGDK